MKPTHEHQDEPTIDAAMSRRLAKLCERPMSTSVFDAKLKSMLPAEAAMGDIAREADASRRMRLGSFMSPLRAISAVLIVAVIAWIAMQLLTPQPVYATMQEMANIHEIAVNQQGHSTTVKSIEEARAALREKWSQSPKFNAPAEMPVMSCCVHEIGERQLGCVTFEAEGVPVTLAVASAKDVCSPKGESRIIDGQRYIVGSADGVNMVMSERDGIWTCLMGRLPLERLANIAASAHD